MIQYQPYGNHDVREEGRPGNSRETTCTADSGPIWTDRILRLCFQALHLELGSSLLEEADLSVIFDTPISISRELLAIILEGLVSHGYLRCHDVRTGNRRRVTFSRFDANFLRLSRGEKIAASISNGYFVEFMPPLTMLDLNEDEQHNLIWLWRHLIVEDALNYLGDELARHGLNTQITTGARPLFEQLSARLSLAHLFNLAWVGAREFASAFMRNHGDVDLSLSQMRGSMRRRSDAHLDGSRHLKPFNAPSAWHFTVPSDFLRSIDVTLDERYITKVPALISIFD